MRRLIAIAFLSLAAGCTASAPSGPPPPGPRPVPPSPPPPAADQCGARAHQHLIGRPRSEIPVPVLPALQRVACTTCPVTQDFNPRRLNFFYDAATGRIAEVRCG